MNFAHSSKQTAANQTIENRQTENTAQKQMPKIETENASIKETKFSATPKPEPQTDNFVCPEPNFSCNLSINRRAIIKFAGFETASSFNSVFNG